MSSEIKAELMQADVPVVYSAGRPPGPGVPEELPLTHAVTDWPRQLALLKHAQIVTLVDEAGTAVPAVVVDLPNLLGTKTRVVVRLFDLTEDYLQHLPPSIVELVGHRP